MKFRKKWAVKWDLASPPSELSLLLFTRALSLKPCMHLKFQIISFDSQSLSAFHAGTDIIV